MTILHLQMVLLNYFSEGLPFFVKPQPLISQICLNVLKNMKTFRERLTYYLHIEIQHVNYKFYINPFFGALLDGCFQYPNDFQRNTILKNVNKKFNHCFIINYYYFFCFVLFFQSFNYLFIFSLTRCPMLKEEIEVLLFFK